MELKAMETLEFSLLESNQTLSIGNNTTDVGQLLINMFGPKRKDFVSAITLTIVYSVIFLSGMVGNICTCLVIVRTNSMQTTTNYYLFSLAVSDLLLIFFGLPPEQYAIWEAYPWRLGEAFCYLRQTVLETTSYASVLTITAFTVERYLAICHPLLAHKIATLSRAVKIILSIWVVSVCVALPYAVHTRTYYAVNLPGTMVPVPDSLVCNIPIDHFQSGFMYYMFQVSTFLFFIGPVTLIIILYILIGIALRRSPLSRGASDERSYSSMHSSTSLPTQPRKVVVRMLVAVTVAFIVCWAPFHTQRLMILYVKTWTPQMLAIQSHIFYTSGVLYFVSSTLNPILYNVISKRYRAAFKQIIFPCCKTRPSQSFNSAARQSDRFSKSQAMVVLKNGNESLRVVFRQEPSDTAVSLEALEQNGAAQCATDEASNNLSSSSGSVEMPSSPVCLQPGNQCQKFSGYHKPCLKKDILLDKYVITNKGVQDMLLLSKDNKVEAAIKKAERPRKSYAHQVNGRISLKMAAATNGADTATYESDTTRGSVVR